MCPQKEKSGCIRKFSFRYLKKIKKDLPEKYSIGNIFRKGIPGTEDKILGI
jgi:hypothetical protein